MIFWISSVPGVEAMVVDEKDNELPLGEAGELVLWSRRQWVFGQGYVGRPEESLRVWRNGWFHTGDKFRRNVDGEFEFLDRLEDAIRRRGENVSAIELENAVLEHSAVAECAAIAVPAAMGEDEVMVVVAVKSGQELTAEALVADLRGRVPGFAVPRYVRFVEAMAAAQLFVGLQVPCAVIVRDPDSPRVSQFQQLVPEAAGPQRRVGPWQRGGQSVRRRRW